MDRDMDEEVDTANECSPFYTFVLGYDGDTDTDDDECRNLSVSESRLFDKSTESTPVSSSSDVPILTPVVMSSATCSVPSEGGESKEHIFVNEPIVPTISCPTTQITVTSAPSQSFSLISTSACIGQNLPASKWIYDIQTLPLDLTLTSRSNKHAIDKSTGDPLHNSPPTTSVANLDVNNSETSETSNTRISSERKNQDFDNELLSGYPCSKTVKPVNLHLKNTPTSSSLIDSMSVITSLSLLNDAMPNEESHEKNSSLRRTDIARCSKAIPKNICHITSPKNSPAKSFSTESEFMSVLSWSPTKLSTKDTSISSSFSGWTITSHLTSDATPFPTFNLSNENHGQQQYCGTQQNSAIHTMTPWDANTLCSHRNTQSRSRDSDANKSSKVMTVTRTVFSTGQLACASAQEQPHSTPENGVQPNGKVRVKESVKTPEKSKEMENTGVSVKQPDPSCRIIPTIDTDIVDFSTLTWPCHDKDYHYPPYGVDGQSPSGRKVMNYLKPVKISCHPVSSPLYRLCPTGNPNDPRTKLPSIRILDQPSRSDNNVRASAKRSKISSPQIEQGLFSRILSFSDHSSSEATSGNSCDETICVTSDTDNRRKSSTSRSRSAVEEMLETKTRTETPRSVSLFENLALLCNTDADTPTISSANSDSVWKFKTSYKDTQHKLKELKKPKTTCSEKRKKSKERHSKSNEHSQNRGHATISTTDHHNIEKATQITPQKRPEKVVLHSANKRKCLGLQKQTLPRSLNTSTGSEKKMTCSKSERKQVDRKVNYCNLEKSEDTRETDNSSNTKIKLAFYTNSQGKRVYDLNCKKDKRNVLDYHLCSLCMLDETVIFLKPPVLRKKSSNCLKCTKKLNPKDLMCKSCKQCFPNMMTYAGHVYNLALFHPSHKSSKDFVCSRCRQTFKSRFLFHTHLAQSKCTRVCLSCDKLFPTRQALGEHMCEGSRIAYVKDFI